jgi:hypothetical protein
LLGRCQTGLDADLLAHDGVDAVAPDNASHTADVVINRWLRLPCLSAQRDQPAGNESRPTVKRPSSSSISAP